MAKVTKKKLDKVLELIGDIKFLNRYQVSIASWPEGVLDDLERALGVSALERVETAQKRATGRFETITGTKYDPEKNVWNEVLTLRQSINQLQLSKDEHKRLSESEGEGTVYSNQSIGELHADLVKDIDLFAVNQVSSYIEDLEEKLDSALSELN